MIKKTYLGFYGAFLLGALLMLPTAAVGQTIRAVGDFLQIGDVKTSHILNGTILNQDISTNAEIDINKITSTSTQGLLFLSNGTKFATTTQLSYSTTTATLTITGGVLATASSTAAQGFTVGGNATTTGNHVISGNLTLSGTCSGCSGTALQASYIAGQSISAGNAVYLASSSVQVTALTISGVDGGSQEVGIPTPAQQRAQTVTGSDVGNAKYLVVTLKKSGTPADNMVFAIQADSAGVPSGTDLATASIAGGTLTTTATSYTLTLNTQILLTSGTTYWVIARRSGSLDGTNYYWWDRNASNQYANGSNYYYDGTWTLVGVNDFYLTIKYDTTAGQLYKAGAAQDTTSGAFFGFAPSAIAGGVSGNVIYHGRATGFSGLSVGGTYFLSNTSGSIGTTAGTLSRKVCIADSSTTCIITSNW